MDKSWFLWIKEFYHFKEDLLYELGIEAYFLLKTVNVFCILFSIISLFSYSILLPLIVSQNPNSLLNELTIKSFDYADHRLRKLAFVFTIFSYFYIGIKSFIYNLGSIIYTINYLVKEYVDTKKKYLYNPKIHGSLKLKTLFVQDIPKDLCNEQKIKEIFGKYPDGIRYIHIIQ